MHIMTQQQRQLYPDAFYNIWTTQLMTMVARYTGEFMTMRAVCKSPWFESWMVKNIILVYKPTLNHHLEKSLFEQFLYDYVVRTDKKEECFFDTDLDTITDTPNEGILTITDVTDEGQGVIRLVPTYVHALSEVEYVPLDIILEDIVNDEDLSLSKKVIKNDMALISANKQLALRLDTNAGNGLTVPGSSSEAYYFKYIMYYDYFTSNATKLHLQMCNIVMGPYQGGIAVIDNSQQLMICIAINGGFGQCVRRSVIRSLHHNPGIAPSAHMLMYNINIIELSNMVSKLTSTDPEFSYEGVYHCVDYLEAISKTYQVASTYIDDSTATMLSKHAIVYDDSDENDGNVLYVDATVALGIALSWSYYKSTVIKLLNVFTSQRLDVDILQDVVAMRGNIGYSNMIDHDDPKFKTITNDVSVGECPRHHTSPLVGAVYNLLYDPIFDVDPILDMYMSISTHDDGDGGHEQYTVNFIMVLFKLLKSNTHDKSVHRWVIRQWNKAAEWHNERRVKNTSSDVMMVSYIPSFSRHSELSISNTRIKRDNARLKSILKPISVIVEVHDGDVNSNVTTRSCRVNYSYRYLITKTPDDIVNIKCPYLLYNSYDTLNQYQQSIIEDGTCDYDFKSLSYKHIHKLLHDRTYMSQLVLAKYRDLIDWTDVRRHHDIDNDITIPRWVYSN